VTSAPDERRREIEHGVRAVRARIDEASRECDRDPSTITLIVVTKTYPASDVELLPSLGVHDVGENRDQEAAAKRDSVARVDADAQGLARLRWHMVGRLQSNKARSVARWADVVHSLDRGRVVDALSAASIAADRRIEGLIQVSLDGDPTRGGVEVEGVLPLADRVAAAPGLVLRGVMAVAPLGMEPSRAFSRLQAVAQQVGERHPGATWLSAGMSGDLEAAIRAGATHVRVGSAVLGVRPPLR
jgi:hypothetical protein